MKTCIFCDIDGSSIISETPRLIAFHDKYPVTEGHVLIAPKAHKVDFFDLDETDVLELQYILQCLKNSITERDPGVTGFNIGMNCGEAAGQTVFHCHVHLIPRRPGDCSNPKGGVRAVISEKQHY
jgi:ATP adenylyltransferase